MLYRRILRSNHNPDSGPSDWCGVCNCDGYGHQEVSEPIFQNAASSRYLEAIVFLANCGPRIRQPMIAERIFSFAANGLRTEDRVVASAPFARKPAENCRRVILFIITSLLVFRFVIRSNSRLWSGGNYSQHTGAVEVYRPSRSFLDVLVDLKWGNMITICAPVSITKSGISTQSPNCSDDTRQ